MLTYPEQYLIPFSDDPTVNYFLTAFFFAPILIGAAFLIKSSLTDRLAHIHRQGIGEIKTIFSNRTKLLNCYCQTIHISFQVLSLLGLFLNSPIAPIVWPLIFWTLSLIIIIRDISHFNDWLTAKHHYQALTFLPPDYQVLLQHYQNLIAIEFGTTILLKLPILSYLLGVYTTYPNIQHLFHG